MKKYCLTVFCLFFIIDSQLFANEKTPNYSILFLGDSLTEGYEIDENKTYVTLIENYWKEQGLDVRVFNGGVSGSTTASAMERLKWFERMNLTHIVLALGANDGLRGLPIEETQKNLKQAIEWAQQREIHVVLAGMQMPPNYGREYTQSFKSLFKELAQMEGVSFLPFLLEGVAGVKELNLPDGIHPNEKGHQVMKENMLKHFNKILKPL